MTRTAVGSAERRVTSLSLPSAAEVMRLQAMQDYPAVSVLCATEPAPRMTATDAARLAALVGGATSRLKEDGAPDGRLLRRTLEELVEDATRRPTRAAVALYVSAEHASSWALPVPVVDRVVVDPTFATRDLVRSLHRTPRHVVLVLTDREARLFDGVADTLLPPPGGPFPLIAAPARSSGRQPNRQATRERGTQVDQTGDQFLRAVDRALGTYLALHPAPLVLVGARRTLTQFIGLSRNVGRLAGSVYGSHARTPLPQLVALIRPILDTYLHGRQDEALALLDRRTDAGRVVTGMPAVWLAARFERPEMLAVEHSLFYPARLSADGHFLEPATDVEHPDVLDDAVDEVIELVLRRGGWVALVDHDALDAHQRVALSIYTS
ncbi:MAG TPA: hypothetical protein VF635_14040 [Propionibacteriaceae bacterium]|jgi:hypothetical protein